MRSDRVPSRLDAGEPTSTRHELAIGQRRGSFGGDVAMAAVMLVARGELPRQAFVDRSATQDQQVVFRVHALHDLSDKAIQVFDAVRLARGL